jgi:hypothetical protein
MSRTNLSNICLVRRAARRVQKQNALYQYSAVHSCHAIGGAHQQTSERVAPPVSVEEKGKTTGDKKENCYYFCLWAFKIKINFIYVVRRAPENYYKPLGFHCAVLFRPIFRFLLSYERALLRKAKKMAGKFKLVLVVYVCMMVTLVMDL